MRSILGNRLLLSAGLNPKIGDRLWKVTLDKHPTTILTQSSVVYGGVIYIGASPNEEHKAIDSMYAPDVAKP
jgi:hypothetical protein